MNGALVYLLCSLADPALCEEHALLTRGMMPCLSNAQAELAAAIRPGWRVARWRCEAASPRKLDGHDTSGDGQFGIASSETGP